MVNDSQSIILGMYDDVILQKKTLIHIFNKTVENLSNKVALRFNGNFITYKELDEYSNAFARYLLQLNISKNSTIGLYLPRGFELFIAHLGILKVGATYIPFDIETPVERVESVLNQTNSKFCVSEKVVSEKIYNISIDELVLLNGNPIDYSDVNGISHIIFTSGSTGIPKGIPIKHFQIAHLIEAENKILNVNSNDLVYQGFSVSFDMWFEEVWISFLTGATLIIADNITSKSFDKLEIFLKINCVTVLHAVPSLLSFIGTDIPTLRLINSGGEACNENVIRKWSNENILLFNSYGPTETTVTATIGQLKIGNRIDVGKPLPNYSISIIDENQNPVVKGAIGEVAISGIGLSEGYYHNSRLTDKSFIKKENNLDLMYGDMIYLTGDLGFINEMGNIIIQGRKDDQVKIRGYRVELGEVESSINSCEDVLNTVVVKKQIAGIDQLIAFYESKSNDDISGILRKSIANLLPLYMIPSHFIKVESFKRLDSGKIDRKSLPDINSINFHNKIDQNFSDDAISTSVLLILTELFPGQEINFDSDFFNDLGGHSLLAAIFVSESRIRTEIFDISILDIYKIKKIGDIISFWKSKSKDNKNLHLLNYKESSNFQYYLCGVMQLVGLFVIFGLLAAQIFIPFLNYYIVASELEGIALPIIVAIVSFIITPPLIFLIILCIKRFFIGEFKEGDYSLWGYTYFKWWFYKRLISIIPSETISNTPFYNFYLRTLGCKVSDNAQLNKFEFGVAELIRIGKNVTISANVILNNAEVENGFLKIRSIIIEDNGYVGTSSVVNGSCVIGNNGSLKDLSSLKTGQNIKKNEIWEGSPAFLIGQDYIEVEDEIVSIVTKKYKFTFFVLILLMSIIVTLPLVPTIVGLHYLDENADSYSFYYLFATPIFSIIYLVLFIIEIVILTKIFNRKILVGTYSVYSETFINKWFTDQLFSLLLLVIKPIFATVYINSIYRLLGAKVGKNTEISNASNVSHHLLEIGDESFIADVAVIGENDIRNQQLIIKKTFIGNKVFIGNSAVIPQGLNLGNNKLIGVLSISPSQIKLDELETDWFGSPAVQLPKRKINLNYPENLTFNPSFFRKFTRAFIEFIRILIPQSLILCFSILFLAFGHDLVTKKSVLFSILNFPLYYISIVALPAFLVTLTLKWLIVGKYKKTELPMWTMKVWLTEAITSLYESIATPYFLEFLKGTIFLPIFLRLLGVKIGKKVFLDTTDFTEFDLVKIGDFSSLNYDSGPQTHLFEDRIMKIGPVNIGPYVTVGSGTIILYNTDIAENTRIQSLSLVMKGESVPPNSNWEGIPIQRNNLKSF